MLGAWWAGTVSYRLLAVRDRSSPSDVARMLHAARNRGGSMPRGLVALLAAVVAVVPEFGSLAHGFLFWTVLAVLAAAGWLVGYATAPIPTAPSVPALPIKKTSLF